MQHAEQWTSFAKPEDDDLPPRYTATPSINPFDDENAIEGRAQDSQALISIRRTKEKPSSTNPKHGLEFLCGPVLARGLQVPSRTCYLTSGFKYPLVLRSAYIGKTQWTAFAHDVKKYARLSSGQWMTVIGGGVGTSILTFCYLGGISIIAGTLMAHKLRKEKEYLNFMMADHNGALSRCVDWWNEHVFMERGLVVRVDVPGHAHDMEYMDVSSSKIFKHRQRVYANTHRRVDNIERRRRYQAREGYDRTRAMRRGRIIIIPIHQAISSLPVPIRSGATILS